MVCSLALEFVGGEGGPEGEATGADIIVEQHRRKGTRERGKSYLAHRSVSLKAYQEHNAKKNICTFLLDYSVTCREFHLEIAGRYCF